jgi:ATP-binding cassette subfamily B protein
MSHVIRRVRSAVKGEFQGQPFVVSAMQETARGIRQVKAFNLEEVAQTRMQNAINDVRRRSNLMSEASARTGPLMETLGGFAVAGVAE